MTPDQHSATDSSPKRRRTAALAVAAGVLGGGAIGLAATLPTSASAAPPATTAPAATTPDADTQAPATTPTDDRDNGRRGVGKGPSARKGLGPLTDEFAQVLGLADAAELRTELLNGKTIAQIAEANDVPIEDVKAFAIDQLKVRLDEAVAEGKLTQVEADAKLAEAATRIDERINKPVPPRADRPSKGDGFGKGPGPGKGLGPLTDEFAQVLGLADAAELRTELLDGKTIAQIAEANDVPIEDVKAFVTDQLKVRLDEAVADGKLTQDEADAKLADAGSHIDELLNKSVPPRSDRGRHGRDAEDGTGNGSGNGSGPNIIESSTSA